MTLLVFRSFILSLSLLIPVVTCITECLERNEDFRTREDPGGETSTFRVINKSPLSLFLVWVNENGQDSSAFTPQQIPNHGADRIHELTTTFGHAFRIYDEEMGLLKEHVIQQAKEDIIIEHACHDATKITKNKITENEEMKALVHDQQAPCLPEDESQHWSCIKLISREDYNQRLEEKAGTVYGFKDQEEAQDRAVGETIDAYWGKNIPLIPRVSRGPGYLKMSFTKKMEDALLPWYETYKKGGPKDAVQQHHVIPGGYTNSHTVPMSILWLPRNLKDILVSELRRVLTWWTNDATLHETATFGIRVYHRESMLINHVDVAATHLASAVIQIAQDGVDEGWPLEILHPDGTCAEVYMQPGEMVLYEGARFMHGRPMRFNGTDFANIFTHFRPAFWNGPGKSPRYDGKLDHEGYLIQEGKVDEYSIPENNDEL